MSEKKLIVIFGATGAQGGGLARAILKDPSSEFAVRAVTRDPEAPKSKALASLGAEVVKGDVDDEASVRAVMQGAYGAYCVTFFWAHYSPETEQAQAKIMAKAARDAGLKHVIWSTLEDVRSFVPLDDKRMPTINGKYKVPHFDGKAEADQYFINAGVPVTFLLASYYWENLIHFGMGPKRDEQGKLSITFPMGEKKMAGIGAEDIGRAAYSIFRKGESLIGKKIGVAGEHISCREMAITLSRHLNEQVSYQSVTPDQYRSLGFPGADDLGNMFQFYHDFEYECNTMRDVSYSRLLNPELKSFDQWVAENLKQIPLN